MKLIDDWPTDVGGIIAYRGVTSNHTHIYAHYSGKSRQNENLSPFDTYLFQKFDWDLNFV